MAPDHPRIDELRRRVDKDPASIAFAQLAEEYRRAGEIEEAIRVCRAGLAQHPGYLSARVTLGRALLETGEFDDAQAELEQVIRVAPDNLAAIRALAEIHQRREEGGTPAEAPPEPELLSAAPLADLDLAFNEPEDQFAEALKTLDFAPSPAPPVEVVDAAGTDASPEAPASTPDPVIEELEDWLQAILADRAARRARP